MANSTCQRNPRERQIDVLILEFEQAAEQGRPLNQEDFLRQHAEFAMELRDYLAGVNHLQGVIAPPPDQAMPTRTFRKIRDYLVMDKIGAGGMGTVYLANHTRLDKTVALKILKADGERDSQAIARFEREMKAVGKLEHPHIVRALDAGDEAGTYFLVMEFLEGCDLGRLVKASGRLEVPLACELIRQAALGLQHAHEHHLVHRDVKPSNLLLSSSGQVKVLDLGLAQWQASVGGDHNESHDRQVGAKMQLELTHEGQIVGTWRYMAPEQFMLNRQVDSRADIFSLGVTFYCLLTGELPLGLGQTAAYLPPIATQRPDVPPELQQLLGRMLAFDQEERVQSMLEVARDLGIYAGQGSLHIASLSSRLGLAKTAGADALDGTASWSNTAAHWEVIPPPIPQSTPTHATAPPSPPSPSIVERVKARLAETPRLSLVTWSASSFAVLAMAVLVFVILSSSMTTSRERRLAEIRIAELRGIADQAMEKRDDQTVEDSLRELDAFTDQFPDLLDQQTVDSYRQYLNQRRDEAQLRQVAADLWREILESRDRREWQLLKTKIAAYLINPQATEINKANSLLSDVNYLLVSDATNQGRVASWSDARLNEFLRTGEFPPSIEIVNEVVRESFRGRLRELAIVEKERREKPAEIPPNTVVPVPEKPVDDDAEQRKRAEDLLKRELELDQQARQEWPIHPDRHGILALIPQDAIGAVGVPSPNQLLQSCRELDGGIRLEVLKRLQTIKLFATVLTKSLSCLPRFRLLAWLCGYQKPEDIFPSPETYLRVKFEFSVEKILREVLTTAPLECYQQDEPVAIVFANPEQVGVKLPIESLNALSAIWDRSQIEKLGVVVGHPKELRFVERSLRVPAGSLTEGKIQTSTLFYYEDPKTVYSLVRDGRLYVGLNRRAVEAVAAPLRAGKSLALDPDLPPREAELLANMDLLVHFGPGAWKQEWKRLTTQMRTRLEAVNDDPKTVTLATDLDDIARDAKSFLLGVKLDQGVQASLLVYIARHDQARLDRFKKLFGQGDALLTLAGLPQEGAIGAFATRGNGLSGAVVAQSLLLLSQQPLVFPDFHFPASNEQRDIVAKAFQEVWNQVEGTRSGTYDNALTTIVVLETSDSNKFIDRLRNLVTVWDQVSLELAGGDTRQARFRFALDEEEFNGRPAHRLSLTVRKDGVTTSHKLWIVPDGKQMILSYDNEDPTKPPIDQGVSSFRQMIRNLANGVRVPGLAEDPAIKDAEQRLPAARRIEVYLWLSAIKKLAEGNSTAGYGSPDYSSASFTLGENSVQFDAWIPLSEIISNRNLIKIDESILTPAKNNKQNR